MAIDGWNEYSIWTDNFNRADETPANVSQYFNGIDGGSNPNLTGNKLVPADSGLDFEYLYRDGANILHNNQYAKAKLTTTETSGGNNGPGLIVRHPLGNNARTHYRLTANHDISGGAFTAVISKVVAGSSTTVASVSSYSWSNGDTWALYAVGTEPTTIYAVRNDVLVMSYVDSSSPIYWNSGSNGSNPGIAYSSTAAGSSIDDFEYGYLYKDFPTTSILDSGAGADENPITTNWTADMGFSADFPLKRLSNKFAGSQASAWSEAYYDLATYGPGTEIYAQLDTVHENNGISALWGVAKDLTSGANIADGYLIGNQKDSVGGPTDTFNLDRVDDGATTHLALGVGHSALVNGDWVGLRCNIDTLEAWKKPVAGSWTLVTVVVDPLRSYMDISGVRLGMMIYNTTARYTNFGGGTFPAAEESVSSSESPYRPRIGWPGMVRG